jgi:hypothetical protein
MSLEVNEQKYKEKYLKYKAKYLELKKYQQQGGGTPAYLFTRFKDMWRLHNRFKENKISKLQDIADSFKYNDSILDTYIIYNNTNKFLNVHHKGVYQHDVTFNEKSKNAIDEAKSFIGPRIDRGYYNSKGNTGIACARITFKLFGGIDKIEFDSDEYTQ